MAPYEPMEAQSHSCASGKSAIIVSDSLGAEQAMIWTNADLLSLRPLQTIVNFTSWYQNTKIFIQEDEFENVAYKLATILSQPECVKESERLPSSEFGLSLQIHFVVHLSMYSLFSSFSLSVQLQTREYAV